MKSILLTLLMLAAYGASAGRALGAEAGEPYNRHAAMKKFTRLTSIPHPGDNAPSADRELLGRTLFFDPRLSGSGWISCASCHNPALSWGDGLPRAIGDGMKVLGRRTPTVLNLAWAELLFWDGRADSLEAQALGPIEAAGEMNMPLEKMLSVVQDIDGYRELFARGYPGEPIGKATVAKALANFERTLVSGQSPFDRWIAGDESAISGEAKTGFDVFNTKGKCASCHEGWSFTDHGFHDIGVANDDLGRGKLLKLEAMQHAFKTPTLRNCAHRAPYLHDGSEATIEDVVEFYDRGGRAQRPSLAPDIQKLHLTAGEKRALVQFLRTLTSNDPPVIVPVLPR